MSKPTYGVQATPAAPAAKPESSTQIPDRRQVFGAATDAFAAYHGLKAEEAGATEGTTADAPDSESAAAETETALSQDNPEAPSDPSQDPDETPDEGEAEGEGDDAGEQPDADEPKADEGAGLTKSMQKRIAKLEEKHQRELQALRAELDEAKGKQADPAASATAPTSTPGSYDPVEAIPEVAALRSQEQQHQQVLTNGRRMLADLETAPDKVLGFLKMEDPEEARTLIREKIEEAQDALTGIRTELVAERRDARRAVTAAKAEVEQVAKAEFPWVADPKDPRAVLRANSLKALGPYANHPSAALFSAVWADWAHAYYSRPAKPAAKPAQPAKPKPTVARRTAIPPTPGKGGSDSASEKSDGTSTATPQGRRQFFDRVAASALK